jgi:hypothetical protein
MAYSPENISESIHELNSSLLELGWNNFSGYEFFTTSVNPAQLKR